MKLTIKLKIVALGAILSILVTTIALVLGNFEYRRRGRDNQLSAIDNWLDNMTLNFAADDYNDTYLDNVKNARDYILKQYENDPSDPPSDATLDDKKNFYNKPERFSWLYVNDGFGMSRMTEEERTFRDDYQELVFLLSDAKAATRGNSVFIAFLGDNKTLFYLADEYSYKKTMNEAAHFPGSRYYNFPGEFKSRKAYFDCNYDKLLNRVIPIDFENQTIAYVFVQYDFMEVNRDANSLMKVEVIALSITSFLMIVAYALGAHFLLIKNVDKLTKSASAFSDDLTNGRPLEKKDPCIKSRDEINQLSDSFVALEENIIKYVDVIQKEAKEKERTNAELSVATSIQLSALPKCIYDDKHASIRAYIKSAKEVGGDFYDYFYLDDHRLVVVISDVSGKGIPAALFMMKSKELIKSAIHRHKDNLEEAVKEVNSGLVSNDKESLFVTSFIGVIDFTKNTITFVNAGHEKPYIVTSKEVIKLDGESNFVIGGEEGINYKQESHSFKKGDFIFLFTDGLNESINADREEFSYERIQQVLRDNKDLSADKIIDVMNKSLENFVGNEEQFDDVTMLIVKNRNDELHLSYEQKEYQIITDIVDRFEEEFAHLPNEVRASAGIVIDELINNLVSYEKREDLHISVDFIATDKELKIVISSNGDDYDPFANHEEKYAEGFHPEMKEGGFGLSIIKDLSKSWNYQYKDGRPITIVIIEIK